MTTALWCWLAAFSGFLAGWFVCLMMIAGREREEAEISALSSSEAERMQRALEMEALERMMRK